MALPSSSTRPVPEVEVGLLPSGAATVPSMSAVPGPGPGVANVKTPQVTSAAAKVFVQTVCVGPVRVPCQYPEPSEEEPVQVAAVFPSREHSRSAVLGRVSNEWYLAGVG
jgi:hypothetical protein